MNVKTLAALVGTLSLGALATGCATAKSSAGTTTEKGNESACQTDTGAPSRERGGEHACGNGQCGATRPQ